MMPDPAPEEPVFTRRKRSTKRRQRASISPPDSPTDETNSAPVAAFRASKLRKESIPKSRKRRGLRPPPVVPGYDLPSLESTNVSGVDYSAESLARLRQKNLTKAPAKKGVEIRKAEEQTGEKKTNVIEENETLRKFASASLKATNEFKGGAGRPDPFSAEWRRGGVRDFDKGVDEDGDAVIVDDFADVDEDVAYVPMKDVDGVGGKEGEESDGEWEKEQLRRSGHVPRGLSDSGVGEMEASKARRIIREEQEIEVLQGRVARGVSLQKGVEIVRAVKREWEKKLRHAEDRERRLVEVERKSREEGKEVERGIEEKKKQVAFYDQLAAHVDDVCDMLKEKYEAILAYREGVLNRMRREVEAVESVLGGGPDEFGRVRSAGLPEIEESSSFFEGLKDPLEDVEENIRSMATLIDLFDRWKRDYPDDYTASFGDAGLGKLVGTLALAAQDDTLRWTRALSDRQLKGAVIAFKAPLYVSLLIRCRWHPRDRKRSEELVQTVGRIASVQSDNDLICTAFKERGLMELKACFASEELNAAELCVCGAITAMRIAKIDIGMGEVLNEFHKRRMIVESLEARNLLRWVSEDAEGLVNDGTQAVAKKLIGRGDIVDIT